MGSSRVIFGQPDRVKYAMTNKSEFFAGDADKGRQKLHCWSHPQYMAKTYSGEGVLTDDTEMDSGGLAPTITATWMIDRIRWKNILRQILPVKAMPGRVWNIPKMTAGHPVWYQGEGYSVRTESGDDTASTDFHKPSVTHITMTARKMAGITGWTTEIAEDSIIGIPEMMFGELSSDMGSYEELAMFQGNAGFDDMGGSGTVGSGYAQIELAHTGDVRYMWDGLIAQTQSTGGIIGQFTPFNTTYNNTIDGGSDVLTKEELDQLIAAVENYNFEPTDIFMRSNVAARLRNTTEYEEFQRLDAIGNRAALIKGYVASFYGSDIFRTDKMPAGTAYGTTATTDSVVLCIDRSQPLIGDRRRINFVKKHRFDYDADEIRVTERLGFVVKHTRGLAKIVDVKDAVA